MNRQSSKLNFELLFMTEVLKLSSLHYGYWDDRARLGALDLDELRRAQTLFTERLLEKIPPNISTILDVGAGIGDNARALSARGYRVTAISPDENHPHYFDAMNDPQVTFHQSRFETFVSTERFDLLLFCESNNQFDARVGLEQCRRLVKPGGHLLVSGMFKAKGSSFAPGFRLEDLEYLKLAREHGFVLREATDITENVLPTVAMVQTALETYVRPLWDLSVSFLATRAAWKHRVVKWFFANQTGYLRRRLKSYERRMNIDNFRARVRYLTLLLQQT
jgi:MPBQ/MSBQ methyltransferase